MQDKDGDLTTGKHGGNKLKHQESKIDNNNQLSSTAKSKTEKTSQYIYSDTMSTRTPNSKDKSHRVAEK